MRLLLLGDYHIHQTRLADCSHIAEQVLKTIQDYEIDYFIQLGDLLDDHRKVEESAYNFTCDFLERLIAFPNLKIIILSGNHDFRNNQIYCQPEHFLNAFKKWPRVTIVDRPQEIVIEGHKIALMPYVPEGRYHEARVQFLGEEFGHTFFLSHQGFSGGKLDNGDIFKGKDNWSESYPMQITGHFHTPHKVASNLRYLGSALPLKHGENDDKIMLLIELEVEGNYKETEIPLRALSVFQTITVDIKEDSQLESKDKKTRWILTNGTRNELMTYHEEYKHIFGDRVQYVPHEKERTIIENRIEINFFNELRQRLEKPLRKLLKRYIETLETEAGFTRLRLDSPTRKLVLNIDHFMALDDLVVPIRGGINKLIGENGSGKSTLLKALEWLLYGGNAPSHDIEAKKKRATKISLEAKGQWKITRVSSPKSLTIEIYDNGENIYEEETAQAIINMSLGTKSVWEATSYLQQKHIGFFFEASEREKRELLSTIFDEDEMVTTLQKKLLEDEKVSKNDYLKTKSDFEAKSDILSQFLQKPIKPIFEEIILEEIPSMPESPTFNHLNYLLIEKEKPLEPIYQESILHPFELDESYRPEEPLYQKEDLIEPIEPIYHKLPTFELKEPVKPKKEPKKPAIDREKVLHNEYLKKELQTKKNSYEAIELPEKCFKYSLERLSHQNESNKLFEKEFEVIEKGHQNESKKTRYRETYQREPSADLISLLLSGVETHCPSCESRLILDNEDLKLAPKGWQKNEHAQQEKRLLLQIDFDLEKPSVSLEEARERLEMTRILEKYPLESIQKAREVQSIRDEIKKLQKEIDFDLSPKIFEEYDRDVEIYRRELVSYEEKLKTYLEQKDRITIEGETIKEKNQDLKKGYLKQLETYKQLSNEIKLKNRNLKKEYESRVKEWETEQRKAYEVKKKHHEAILEQNKLLKKQWLQEIEHWKKEIDENKKRYREEVEKLKLAHQKEIVRIEKLREERKEIYEKALQRQAKEKEAYRKAKENWKNAVMKMEELEEEVETKKESYQQLKELLFIFKQTQSEILEQKLRQWNLYFDQLLKRCFDDISAEIKTEKETKNGTIDKVSFDIVLDGIRRNDIKSASGGETDVFSIAFLLATQRLISNSFKLILLDESLSQISVKRVQERITEVLTDYLSYPGIFCVIASHDESLFAEENVIAL